MTPTANPCRHQQTKSVDPKTNAGHSFQCVQCETLLRPTKQRCCPSAATVNDEPCPEKGEGAIARRFTCDGCGAFEVIFRGELIKSGAANKSGET